MFKKNNEQKPLEIKGEQITAVIGEGYVFTGDLHGSTIIRIEGKVVGNINVEGGVILGERGVVEGDIKTKSAIIYGTVNGNVKTTQLEIKTTGNINGDISTDILEVEIGAIYNGKLNMQRPQLLAEAS
jgi:cytoskeletal protein CcmA (bactofilin family)